LERDLLSAGGDRPRSAEADGPGPRFGAHLRQVRPERRAGCRPRRPAWAGPGRRASWRPRPRRAAAVWSPRIPCQCLGHSALDHQDVTPRVSFFQLFP